MASGRMFRSEPTFPRENAGTYDCGAHWAARALLAGGMGKEIC